MYKKKFKAVAKLIAKARHCECQYLPGERPGELSLVVKWGDDKCGAWTVVPAQHSARYEGDPGSPLCETFIRRAMHQFAKDVTPELPKRFDGAMSVPSSVGRHGHGKSNKKKMRACPGLEKMVTGRANPDDFVKLSDKSRRFANSGLIRRTFAEELDNG